MSSADPWGDTERNALPVFAAGFRQSVHRVLRENLHPVGRELEGKPLGQPGRNRLGPQQRVKAYVEAHRSELIDLNASKPIKMTKKQVQISAGFLKTLKGRRCLVISPRRWNLEFGTESHTLLNQLERQGRLHATENLQTQTRVRANETKDRVYAIRID